MKTDKQDHLTRLEAVERYSDVSELAQGKIVEKAVKAKTNVHVGVQRSGANTNLCKKYLQSSLIPNSTTVSCDSIFQHLGTIGESMYLHDEFKLKKAVAFAIVTLFLLTALAPSSSATLLAVDLFTGNLNSINTANGAAHTYWRNGSE